ncbi:serine hydrolase family protein (plasmid) [Sinorhizobium sp. BG8]|nr:serine hydrolase family protein [Sinorhizobium sp. BG8]
MKNDPSVATLILPGLNGSGSEHWQRHWARDRPDCRVVEQDNWTCPDLRKWLARAEETIERTPGVWLVAHSLGCVLAANLASSRVAQRIRGALLVAPCDLEITERLHPCVLSFGTMPQARLPFPSLVVGSSNDPYMPPDRLRSTVRHWGSTQVGIGPAGHINVDSGFGRWTAGYDLFDRFVSAAERSSGPDQAYDAAYSRALAGVPVPFCEGAAVRR